MATPTEIDVLSNEVKDLRALVEKLIDAAGLQSVADQHHAENREKGQRRNEKLSQATRGRRGIPGG